MAVDTKTMLVNEDGSITFPFLDRGEEKPTKKQVYRHRRKTVSYLRRKLARLERDLNQEMIRDELVKRINNLEGAIRSYRQSG